MPGSLLRICEFFVLAETLYTETVQPQDLEDQRPEPETQNPKKPT